MASTISLFRLIDEQLLDQAGFSSNNPLIQYEIEDELIDIRISEQEYSVISINDYDSSWTPELHNLLLNQTFSFNNFDVFFGKEAITMPTNKIGIAVHIYSRESNFQRTIPLLFSNESIEGVEFNFNHEFKKDSLKGIIHFEYFFFLKEVNEVNLFQAEMEGIRLTEKPLLEYKIAIDGSGSMFPIVDVHEPGKPLWSVNMSWVDPLIDSFNVSNISIRLNQGHERYKNLIKISTKVDNYLMSEIMMNAMSLIVQTVINDPEISLEKLKDESADDSIGKVVWYWISTFGIDVDSPISISNSFHDYFESKM
ncbi:hypothetical protein [Carnobacterium sp.]|uniref:hypothetical protein n=1 Tax=Carnobacterium sp. TaxID=48221 RepID=UPI002FCA7B8A